jgi:hypothetical protein
MVLKLPWKFPCLKAGYEAGGDLIGAKLLFVTPRLPGASTLTKSRQTVQVDRESQLGPKALGTPSVNVTHRGLEGRTFASVNAARVIVYCGAWAIPSRMPSTMTG